MQKNKKLKNIIINVIFSAVVVFVLLPLYLVNCMAKEVGWNILKVPVVEDAEHEVIYENGMHYINLPSNDPAFPSFAAGDEYKFIVYCMNNSLLWPHVTTGHPNVPKFTDGYLNANEYKKVLDQLTLLLYAGYPNNARNSYELTDNTTISDIRIDQFLVPENYIKQAFPYLATETISYKQYVANDKEQSQLVSKFMREVLQAQLENKTQINGVSVKEITNSVFYKAVSCLFYASDTGKDPLELFVLSGYAAQYFVTEEEAYNATQNAVWYLLKENNIADNNKNAVLDSELAKNLYEFATTANLSDFMENEPQVNEITESGNVVYGYDSETGEELSAPIVFSYDAELGKYVSNRNVLNVPVNFPQVFDVDLPEGMSVLETGNNQVEAGQYYTLVSDTMPDENASITFKADAKWIKALRQYSPKDSTDYQHMVGEIVDRKVLTFKIGIKNSRLGELTISKEISGNASNPEDEFTFIVKAAFPDGEPVIGKYGDVTFDLTEDGRGSEAIFTLKGGESITISGLPAGVTYTVTENETNNGYLTRVNGEIGNETSGTILAREVSKEIFLSTKISEIPLDEPENSNAIPNNQNDAPKPYKQEINKNQEIEHDLPNSDNVKVKQNDGDDTPEAGEVVLADIPAQESGKLKKANSVKTGDNNNFTIYIVAAIVSICILLITIYSRRHID